MSGADEEWLKAAMTDDTVVVELLVRLHHAPPPPPPPRKPAAFPLEWTVRQRRSKSVCIKNNTKKPAHSHRASPTTPLSWSAATSFSGGSADAVGGGSEESSRLEPFKGTRSKVSVVDCGKPVSKRSRKKKTLAELKDEESMLLKERRELKRDMAALRLNLERQRTRNNNLKRMKIELQPRLASESTSAAETSISCQPQHEFAVSHPNKNVSSKDALLQSYIPNVFPGNEVDSASESKFILPDLNIMFNEPSSDAICGIS